MALQDNLKHFREKAGFTAKEFADLLEVPYGTYVSYENRAREPKYELLIKIADALHVSIDDLLGRKISNYKSLLNKCQKMDFIVLPDNTSRDSPSVNIGWVSDDKKEEWFHFTKEEFIQLMETIPNSLEYNKAKQNIYLFSFREWQSKKINDWLKIFTKEKWFQSLMESSNESPIQLMKSLIEYYIKNKDRITRQNADQ